jgi:hypothetical protein
MKLLHVTYDSLFSPFDPSLRARLIRAAETIADLTGLVWKIWLYDEAGRMGAGLYLFKTDAHARAWGDGALCSLLESLPGIRNVRIRYFDLEERLTALTHGQLAMAARSGSRLAWFPAPLPNEN